MKLSKKTSLKKFIFGDFDKDGVKNIDDPYPFDSRKKKIKRNLHRSTYYDPEVKMSDVFQHIEKHNNSHIPFMKKFVKQNPGSKSRIKSMPSTIKKLSRKSLNDVKDVAGVLVTTKNRKEAYNVSKRYLKRYSYNAANSDDYYKNPKNDVYYAIHHEIYGKDGKRLELQIKSEPMYNLQNDMHLHYKKGADLSPFRKRAKDLFDKGF